MRNWKWYEILDKETYYVFEDLIPKNTIMIGFVNDENADYSHTEHRFYKIGKKYVYVHSSGCSCWDSSDAVREWANRKEFNSADAIIKHINDGEYEGYTIPKDVIKEIKKSVKKLI